MEFRREERVKEFYQISTFVPHEDEAERGNARKRGDSRSFLANRGLRGSFRYRVLMRPFSIFHDLLMETRG
jgi:hypothetical protein